MKIQAGFFKSVKPLPSHKLEVVMQTDTLIVFDFTSRLGTMRFGALVDDELFSSARTDGSCILFGDAATGVRRSADDFVDLMLVDRTRSEGEGGGKYSMHEEVEDEER